jgi:acetyl esterase/lipase
MYCVELKGPSDHVRPNQEAVHRLLRRAEVPVFILRWWRRGDHVEWQWEDGNDPTLHYDVPVFDGSDGERAALEGLARWPEQRRKEILQMARELHDEGWISDDEIQTLGEALV